MGSYLSIITLNVNGLNASTKNKDWLNGCMLSKRGPPRNRGHIQTESEGLEKIFHANRDQKKTGVAIFISDKIDFEIKAVKRDKGHYIMIKGSIQEEDITIINIYAPNIGAHAIFKANANKYERGN